MSAPHRNPAGAPDSTGGQFAAGQHDESLVSLASTPGTHSTAHEAFVDAAMDEPGGIEDLALYKASGDDADDVGFENAFWPARYDPTKLAPETKQYIREEFSRWASENRDAVKVLADEHNQFGESPEVIGQAWWSARNGEAEFEFTFGRVESAEKADLPAAAKADAVATARAGALLDSGMAVDPIELETGEDGIIRHR